VKQAAQKRVRSRAAQWRRVNVNVVVRQCAAVQLHLVPQMQAGVR